MVSGPGGIGKTSLAARYYHDHQDEYEHLAWVFVEHKLVDALLSLAPELGLTFAPTSPPEARFELLIKHMRTIEGTNLLVIDNADEVQQLKDHLLVLGGLPNFQVLVTTRLAKFSFGKMHRIGHLDKLSALTLFHSLYEDFDDSQGDTLLHILEAIDYNTLVIELLAKNLNIFNNSLRKNYPLDQLLADIQQKGLLALSQSKAVETTYQSKASSLRSATPEAIIEAMYDISPLEEREKQLLSIFALLPAEKISFLHLEELNPDIADIDQHLIGLYEKGWIELDKGDKSLRCSPVVQGILLQQSEAQLMGHTIDFIRQVQFSIENSLDIDIFKGDDFEKISLYVRYAESIITKSKRGSIFLEEYLGNFFIATGDVSKALLYYQMMRRSWQTRHQSDRDNPNYIDGMVISCEKIGDAYIRLGDIDKAMERYEEGLALAKQLHEQHPQNVNFQTGLGIGYQRLGEIHYTLGNLQTALHYYEKDLQLSEQLFETDPENAGFQKGLGIAYDKLGKAKSDLGELTSALTFFQKQAAIFEQLLQTHPQDAWYQYGLAIANERLGDTHAEFGQWTKALPFFQTDCKLLAQLLKTHPQNVGFRQGLAIAQIKLGDNHKELDALDLALSTLEESTSSFVQLSEAHPQDVSVAYGLSIAYTKIGEVHFEKGNWNAALDFFEKRLAIGRKLHEAHPRNVHFTSGLAIACQRLGDVHSKLDAPELALAYFQDAKTLFEPLYKSDPQNVKFKNALAVAYIKLGEFFDQERSDASESRKWLSKAQSLLQELAEAFPDYAESQKNLAEVLQILRNLEGK